jgi:hypothetical protein
VNSRAASVVLLLAIGCGDSAAAGGEAAGGAALIGRAASGGAPEVGGAGGEGGHGGDVDEAAGCVGTFGEALTDDYGRIDGTVVALVKPSDRQCPTVNDDHAILEVEMEGAVYRMVINVGAPGEPAIRYASVARDMPNPAFEEGWHLGVQLDYVVSFDVHAEEDFEQVEPVTLAQRISDELVIGEKVSVYTTSSGGASAHLIHRNSGYRDGAIFLQPGGPNPRALLFHFEGQSF